MPSQRLQWIDQARAWHRALFELGHPVDVVRATGPFAKYALVVVPGLYLATVEQAAALADYVAGGGRIAVGPFSGVVDADDRVHPRGAPGPLRELLGVEIDEQWPLADGVSAEARLGDRPVSVRVWAEWLEALEGTEVLGRYAGGPLDGRPAATRRTHGAGSARYLSTIPDQDGLRSFLAGALEECGLPARRAAHPSLEVVTRSDESRDYTFVLNHGTAPVRVVTPDGALDLLSVTRVGADTVVGARDALVLTTPRGDQQPFLTLSEPTT
jgi:beta-galactosidase